MEAPTWLLVVLAATAGMLARTITLERPPAAPLECRSVRSAGAEPLPSTEDVDMDYAADVALVSAGDHRARTFGSDFDAPGNGIYGVDLAAGDAALEKYAVRGAPAGYGMAPHGISVIGDHWFVRPADEDADAFVPLLLVVNHRADGDQIDAFHMDHGARALDFQWTARHPLMISVNDVAALSENAFLVTNDHNTTDLVGQHMQDAMASPRTPSVVHCRWAAGETICAPATDVAMVMANGLQRGTYPLVHVATTLGTPMVYNLAFERSDRELELREAIEFEYLVDNIARDPRTGELFIGSHGGPLTFLAHTLLQVPSPSLVYKTDPNAHQAEVVFSDSGDKLSAISVGVPFYDKAGQRSLVVGGVFEDEVLICQM